MARGEFNMNAQNSSSTPLDETFVINRITFELFVSLATLISLVLVTIYYLIPLAPEVKEVLVIADSIFALVFIADFFIRLNRRSHGIRYPLVFAVLDLLSGIPGVPFLRYLRLPRLLIAGRALRRHTTTDVVREARKQLAQSTLLITLLVAMLVITVGSALVVSFEAQSPDANIQTGEEAVWWSLVTVATVGYGDYAPVTAGGRIIGSVMMVVGVSIFTVLTSFIASSFLNRNRGDQEEMAALRKEVAEIKNLLESSSIQSQYPGADNPQEGP
jgi:voltage-gated potassium channel